jgi:hypothetical protein
MKKTATCLGLDCYAFCVDHINMNRLLNERTATIVIALGERPSGLRLSDLAQLAEAPLSSTQRTVESLLDDGIVIADGETRPLYRLAPEVPTEALIGIAEWRLSHARATALRQAITAMFESQSIVSDDIDNRLRKAMAQPSTAERLRRSAERLIWWQKTDLTLRQPGRLIAQAMAIGTDDDIATVEAVFGDDVLRQVLAAAPPGVFGARRWDYWHLRFGYRRTPPLPTRAS